MKKYYQYVILTAIIGLSLGIYWNSRHNQFVNMDDLDLIVRNKYIKTLNFENIQAIFTPGAVGSYQPVRTLSYALDYHFWKLNPVGYHLTNIFCHAVSAILVYLIVTALAQDVLLAALAALLFAVHPVHVEAVTWLSGRRDVLAVAFALLSFYCFLGCYRKPPSSISLPSGKNEYTISLVRYLLALIFFTLGLLTKSVVVVVPLLFALYEVCFRPPLRLRAGQAFDSTWRRAWPYVPFVLIMLWFLRVFMTVSRASGVARAAYHGGDVYTTFLTMLRVSVEYIYLLFAPTHLSLTYGIRPAAALWEPSMLIALLVLGLIGGLMILAWQKSKLVFFGMGWFFISLLPVSNIIPIGVVKADRYLYLPSVGFCLVFAWLIGRGWTTLTQLTPKRVIISGYWLIAAMLLASYAFLTFQRNQDWKDSETLWTATLDADPQSTIALNNLGRIYADQGMYDKALVLYEKLLDDAPNQDQLERVYANMAEAYLGQQMFDEALEYYQKALETNPEYIGAYLGLAQVATELGQYEKAQGIYESALELEPQNEAIYNQLGNLAFVQGNYLAANAYYQKAIALNHTYLAAYNGLGLSYANQGDLEHALATYQQALQIEPTAAAIRNSLGSLYMAQGETARAIAEFQASVQAEPQNADVRNNLGVLLLQTGRAKEALGELMAAVRLQPENAKAISNLGLAYAQVGLAPEAIQMYRWALQRDPTLLQTQILLGDVCVGAKDFACAIDAYQQALKLQNDNPAVQAKLKFAQEHAP